MAIFRVEKTHDYTVMANHHLRDTALSLKAKGLLSLMLSLPDDWDFTTRGLAAICKDGVDSINAAIHELEQSGYVTRCRIRNEKGQVTIAEYTIWETPQITDSPAKTPEQEPPEREKPKREKPILDYPRLEKPKQEKPRQAAPKQAKPSQLNTKKPSKDKYNTPSYNPSYPSIPVSPPDTDGWTDAESLQKRIKSNIEYDILKDEYSAGRLDEVVNLIVETLCSTNPVIPIGSDAYPASLVRERMLSINSLHIQYVFDCLNKNATEVHNIKKYLLTVLFNAPATMSNYYKAMINHDTNY